MDQKKEGISHPLLTTLLMIAVTLGLSVIVARQFRPQLECLWPIRTNFRQAPSEDRYTAAPDPGNLPVSRGPSDTIGLDRMLALRRLLESGRFEALNTELASYQNSLEEDPLRESKLFNAYNALAITDPRYEELIHKWIDAFPGHYQPHLVMGKYYYAKGWQSRGTKWRKETPDEQIEAMHRYFSKSEQHLKQALIIHPNLIVAYNTLIGIYNTDGDPESENSIIAKSMELFPYSYQIGSTASWAKQPRWGGSYAEMGRLAKAAEDHADANPRLTLLYGFIYYDQGRVLVRNKKYREAKALFEKALTYGDCPSFYYEIARVSFFDLKDYNAALASINKCIELGPPASDNYLIRARIYFQSEVYTASMENLTSAATIDPWDEDVRQWRQWASKNLLNQGHRLFKTDLHLAIQKYTLSLEFDPANYESCYWKGVANYRLKALDAALSDFISAIDLNPQHFVSYRMIDTVLARNGRWDEIIGYWNLFLEHKPDHAGAYYERSGTYYHKGDLKSALADLEQACRSGSRDACRQYRKVQPR